MIICPKCNAQLEDDAKFCGTCGAPVEAPAAETPVAEAPVAQPIVTEAPAPQQTAGDAVGAAVNTAVDGAKDLLAKAKKAISAIPAKFLKIGIAAVALIVVLAIVISLFAGSGAPKGTLYIKDGELNYSKLSGKSVEITEDLDGNSYSSSYAQIVGDKIFYLDDADGPNLYYRYVNKPNKEPVKLDKDVSGFMVSTNGKIVTYATDGALYQHNLKDAEKVSSDVYDFTVSTDGKKIIFVDDDGDMYLKKFGKDKEKLEKDVSDIVYADEKLSTVYFQDDDGDLYKKTGKKDKKKIDSEVTDVICVYESGDIYYTKSDSKEITAADYVIDDMKETDENLEEPEYPDYPDYPDYPSWYEYETDEEYDAAYEAYQAECDRIDEEYDLLMDEYYEARELYWEKDDRDDIREELEDMVIDQQISTLYFYNGSKSKVVTENYSDFNTYADEKAAIVYSTTTQEEIEKVKLSEIDYAYEVEEMIQDAFNSSSEIRVAVEDKENTVKQDDAESFDLSEDGKTLFYIADTDDDGHGTLYKTSISGKKLGKAKVYDKDVYHGSFINNKDYAYSKDYDSEDSTYELYLNKKKIASDVYEYIYDEDSKDIAFITDYDDEDGCGTLNLFNGSKAKKVSDDVYDYDFTLQGKLIYLYDVSNNSGEGELYRFTGSKGKLVDEDVSRIIPIIDITEVRLSLYY